MHVEVSEHTKLSAVILLVPNVYNLLDCWLLIF
jgi:hypothetical protein